MIQTERERVNVVKKILIIDDETGIRQVLKIHLRGAGYEVETAATAAEGLALITEEYDLVICDLKLPDMDGLDVIRNIKERFADLPVIVVSGFIDPDVVDNAVSEGVFEYLMKPFMKEDLLDVINRAFSAGV